MIEYNSEIYKGFSINWYYDEDPRDPRIEFDGHLSHIICFHSRYDLGDRHDYRDVHSFLTELIYDTCGSEYLVKFFVDNAEKFGIEFKLYDESDGLTNYKGWFSVFGSDYGGDSLEEGIDYYLGEILDSAEDEVLLDILDPFMLILPVSIYDHSGITIWIGGSTDRWDSGTVGFSYQTKEDTLKNWSEANEDNWKDFAEKNMDAEMKWYDQYLTGEVFGYTITDEDDEEVDSCWGYYGTESIEETNAECRDFIDEEIERREVQAEIDWEEGILNNMLEFTNA